MEQADEAQKYGEMALENIHKCRDSCMAAQMEFSLAIVAAWKVYLRSKSSSSADYGGTAAREQVGMILLAKLEQIRKYRMLDVSRYEEQMRAYLRYLE